MILFIARIFDSLGSKCRRKLFAKRCKECGKNVAVYGKVYQVNPNLIVGDNVKIYPGVQFFGDGVIRIGNNVSIGNNTMLFSSRNAGITIGDNTHIAAQGYIVDMNHGIVKGTLIQEQKNVAEEIVIGSDVWLGANVTVLKGVHMENGAVIGAKSLVNKNISENAIAVGIPAKVIGERE